MHVKITTSGSRRYVQLVESYRDDAARVKKRTVATLGRLDQVGGEIDSVISGLLKVAGHAPIGGQARRGSAKVASSSTINVLGFLDSAVRSYSIESMLTQRPHAAAFGADHLRVAVPLAAGRVQRSGCDEVGKG